jgi:pimeloyl-ACP methyl ester carboxylesterase
MGSMSQFFPIIKAIREAHGCGKSPKPNDWDSYAFSAMALDVEAAWDRMVERPWYQSMSSRRTLILAHSFGTHLAMNLCVRLSERATNPDPVSFNVLFCTFLICSVENSENISVLFLACLTVH